MSESPIQTDRREGSSTHSPPRPEPISPHDKTVISKQPQMAVADPVFTSRIAELAKGLEGQQLDGFALDELVGGGGMGAVFRGRDLSLGRQVAIKVVPNTGNDADSVRRFRVEAQSAAKLDHPNIARVYYVGASENWNYIVFEYIDGINLRDLVATNGPLTLDDSVYFIRQIADALEHACSREVVHRDIKPSNVLLTQQGQVKLVDMGLARTTENDKSTDLTASGVTLGTFDYISPEQARDPRQADVRSDLYSLGCTWYYLLTGRPPFPDGTMIQKLLSHGSDRPEDPRVLRSDLSRDVVAILNKLMAKRPQDRYQRPVDLILDLQILAELQNLPRSRNQPHAHPTYIAPTWSGASMLPWLFAIVAVVLAMIGLEYVDRQASDYPLPPPQLVNTKNESATATKALAPTREENEPVLTPRRRWKMNHWSSPRTCGRQSISMMIWIYRWTAHHHRVSPRSLHPRSPLRFDVESNPDRNSSTVSHEPMGQKKSRGRVCSTRSSFAPRALLEKLSEKYRKAKSKSTRWNERSRWRTRIARFAKSGSPPISYLSAL